MQALRDEPHFERLANRHKFVTLNVIAEPVMSSSLAESVADRSSVPPALAEIQVGTPCVRCGTSISRQYFVANGHVVCANCRERLQGSIAGALRLGGLAAIVSAGAYHAIYALWHLNFVLIAVIAGVAIGLAVRRGAQGNRALRYRFLALGLTYLCVASTYLPALLELPDVHSPLAAVLRALYLPFLMLVGLKNPVTLLLLGFGLHEAWKLSAPNVLNVDGPFHASDGAASS